MFLYLDEHEQRHHDPVKHASNVVNGRSDDNEMDDG